MNIVTNIGTIWCIVVIPKDTQFITLTLRNLAATYGVPEHMPIKETDPQKPINPYGLSKLMMEEMMDSH